MAYKYFEAFLPIQKQPNVKYKQDWEAFVHKQFSNSYTWFDVEDENQFGTLTFESMKVRVTSVFNPTTGLKLSDDWKTFLFDTNYKTIMGKRYRYNESVWLTVNTGGYDAPTQTCIVRKCNNYLTMYNTYGDIHKEPCLIDPALKYGNIYNNNSVNIPQGTIKVWLQFNKFTKEIAINHRFIIGFSEVYKVKNVINYLNDNTFDIQGSPLIELEMQLDTLSVGDDFENLTTGGSPVLPYDSMVRQIMVLPQNYTIMQNESKIYTCYYQNDKNNASDTFEFTVLTNTIPTDRYVFEVINGNTFAITNNKKYTKETLAIQCKNLVNDKIKVFNFTLGGLI